MSTDKKGDTIHQIPDFNLQNQFGNEITASILNDKITISNFIFTHCTSICPPMSQQMRRLYSQFKSNPTVQFISHTIDPKRDTVERLFEYSSNLDVNSPQQWHFLTGDKTKIYELARNGYYNSVMEDESNIDGFIHSSSFILVDSQRHMRGYYDGIDPDAIDELKADIELLLDQNNPHK